MVVCTALNYGDILLLAMSCEGGFMFVLPCDSNTLCIKFNTATSEHARFYMVAHVF